MVRCNAVCAVFLLSNHKPHCTMWCGAVRCNITCGAMRLCHFASGFGAVLRFLRFMWFGEHP